MNRRKFLQALGIGASSVALGKVAFADNGGMISLREALSDIEWEPLDFYVPPKHESFPVYWKENPQSTKELAKCMEKYTNVGPELYESNMSPVGEFETYALITGYSDRAEQRLVASIWTSFCCMLDNGGTNQTLYWREKPNIARGDSDTFGDTLKIKLRFTLRH